MSANRTNRVTVLVTAESIIAGFMIAYGALNGQMLFDWSRVKDASLMPTYIAGIVIYAIVLTCLVSIILLFTSVPTHRQINGGNNKDEEQRNLLCNAGYDLFLMAILGSAVFVFVNGLSIHHFIVTDQMPISCIPLELANVLFKEFLFYAVFLVPLVLLSLRGTHWLAQRKVHWFARTHLLLIVLVVAVVLAGAIALLCVPSAGTCFLTLFSPA
jgi:hypothetical protein